jgi:hypothetical protein
MIHSRCVLLKFYIKNTVLHVQVINKNVRVYMRYSAQHVYLVLLRHCEFRIKHDLSALVYHF